MWPPTRTAKPRALVVWLPFWAIERSRHRARPDAGAPADLHLRVTPERGQQVVVRACLRAQAAGIRPGLPLTQARALVPGRRIRVAPHHPRRDQRALQALALALQRYVPRIALDDTPDTDALLLDLRGCQRLHPDEDALMRQIAAFLATRQITSHLAIAPTFGAAWALARFGRDARPRIDAGHLRAALGPLPVAALRLDAATGQALADLGLERIEHLLALPPATLPARFGPHLTRQLQRALGQAPEVHEPVRRLPPLSAERLFDGPSTQWEALEQTARALLADLTEQLHRRARGARTLRLVLIRSDLPALPLDQALTRPSRDPRHLWALLRPALERAELGFGVEGMQLSAPATGPLPHAQAAIPGVPAPEPDAGLPPQRDHAAAELIDRLSERLGTGRVLTAALQPAWLPEQAVTWRPALAETFGSAPTEAQLPRDRPTHLFAPPIPTEVLALTPDGPVHRLRWQGQDVQPRTCVGPERLRGPWWRTGPPGQEQRRDYFTVQLPTGAWLWLGRSRDGSDWFIHGQWA